MARMPGLKGEVGASPTLSRNCKGDSFTRARSTASAALHVHLADWVGAGKRQTPFHAPYTQRPIQEIRAFFVLVEVGIGE